MVTFIIFNIAVAIYVVFLLWCLTPLVLRPQRRRLGWLRVAFGVMLAAANLLPPLAWPLTMPIATLDPNLAEQSMAVMLCPRTLPYYISNVWNRASATAIIVEISYPIEIAGILYAPVVRTACTARRMIAIDKGVQIISFENHPTVSGGEFLAQTGNAIIALDRTDNLCSMADLPQPGPLANNVEIAPTIYLVRGEADNTQVYEFQNHTSAVAVDDIVLQEPQVVLVEHVPARDVIGLDVLWPMERPGEMYIREPAIIQAYRRLPALGGRGCVTFVNVYMDFGTMTPTISRSTDKTALHNVPAAQQPAYCRDALKQRIPQPSPRSEIYERGQALRPQGP